MTKGRTSKSDSHPKLAVPRGEAIRKIQEQIQTGRQIKDQRMSSMADLEIAQERRTQWLENNVQILTRLFDSPFFDEEYHMVISLDMDSAITFGLKEKYFKEDIDAQIGRLESFLERLKIIPEARAEELIGEKRLEKPFEQEQPEEIQSMEVQLREILGKEWKPPEEKPFTEKPSEKGPLRQVLRKAEALREEPLSPAVFSQDQLREGNILLIHGRDEATKESVSKFIERLGLRTLVLHEQPDGGRSLIERAEEYSQINFAIILITPDDIAAPGNKPKERQIRVSQNVIFEFGYFAGKLGRGRVCVLYKEGVEIPSDYSGAVYIPMDSRDRWQLLVAKEIKQAGIEVDLNKAI